MLCLTKIKRSYIIEHVMPSDLDDKDIKHGLYLKEKMIQEMTDDYVKKNFPNWKQIERQYRKNGLVDICDKLVCGEMDQNDIVKPKPVRTELWMRIKPFQIGEIKPQPKDPDEFLRYEAYDFDRLELYDSYKSEGYSPWIKSDEDNTFNIKYEKDNIFYELDNNLFTNMNYKLFNHNLTHPKLEDVMVQFQLVIIGENAIRYYPFQDMSHYSGFSFVQDELKIYDPQNWDRENNSLLKGTTEESTEEQITNAIKHQEEYYRFFFKNYKGYYNYQFLDDYEEWIQANYPKEKEVRTLQSDPFRLKYVSDDPRGTECAIVAKQWIKTNYKADMMNLTMFKILVHNTEEVDE